MPNSRRYRTTDKDMDKKIAGIVVTYNRKELLAECLAAICAQEYKPAVVYVIDNASTDGTSEWITANGYDREKEGILFHYVLLPENIGGSGGFYTGLKMAHESEENFDAFWLMDDDGVADKSQLRHLVAHLDTHDYLSPLVIAKEDSTRCAFYDMSVDEMKSKAVDGMVINIASPFNGVLYSRKLVDQVGYPIRDMFMWGDERNYHFRCIDAGINPYSIIDAIHIHPKNRQTPQKIWNYILVIPEQDWKLYLFVRNNTYNSKQLEISSTSRDIKNVKLAIKYILYFTFFKPSWYRIKIICKAMRDGYKEDFSRLKQYIK